MLNIVKTSRIRYYILLAILLVALLISAPLVAEKISSYHKREQIISDFVDAAFSHGVHEGRYGKNLPMTLHKWEQESISVSFAMKAQKPCCHMTAYYPEFADINEITLSKMSSEDAAFYTSVQKILPPILAEFGAITGRKLVVAPSAMLKDQITSQSNVMDRIWIRRGFYKSPLSRKEKCRAPEAHEMIFDHPPRRAIFFYKDRCGNADIGLMMQNIPQLTIKSSLCSYFPLEDTPSAIEEHTRGCLVRALGLPNGVTDTDRSPKTSAEDLLHLLYCPELKSGITIKDVTDILRGDTKCFSRQASKEQAHIR